MAKDLNKVMVTGRLGRDVELNYTANGEAVATFSVASGRPVKDEREPTGWREETEWFRVVAWRDMAERIAKSAVKGTKVYVEGRLQTQEYTDKQGQKAKSVELILSDYIVLEGKNKVEGVQGEGSQYAHQSKPVGNKSGANRSTAQAYTDEPDDLPF